MRARRRRVNPVLGTANVDTPDGSGHNAPLAAYSPQLRQQADVQRVRGLRNQNLAAFYLDSIAEGEPLLPRQLLRDGSVGGLGAATVVLNEMSSYIGYGANGADHYNDADPPTPGFWDTATRRRTAPSRAG